MVWTTLSWARSNRCSVQERPISKSWKTGGCHCGGVQWKALTEDDVVVQDCNCSICEKTGFLHLIVPRTSFELLSGDETLATYMFNTGVAKHYFCKVCGVKSFYVPRSNPDGYSLNLRCMDQSQFSSVTIEKLDGRNWEQSAGKLKELSRDS